MNNKVENIGELHDTIKHLSLATLAGTDTAVPDVERWNTAVQLQAEELAEFFHASTDEPCCRTVMTALVAMWMSDFDNLLPMPADNTWGAQALDIAAYCVEFMTRSDAPFSEKLYEQARHACLSKPVLRVVA